MVTVNTKPNDAPAAAGSLESLAQQAEALEATAQEAEGGQVGQGADEAPKLTNAQIIGGALAGARDVFCAFTGFDSPKKHLGASEVESLAGAWATVADKHGVNLAEVAGDYAAEIAAVVITLPIGIAVVTGVRAEAAEREAKEGQKGVESDKPATLPAPAPGPVATFQQGKIEPSFANGR